MRFTSLIRRVQGASCRSHESYELCSADYLPNVNILSSPLVQCHPTLIRAVDPNFPLKLMVFVHDSSDPERPLADLGRLDTSNPSRTWIVQAPGGSEVIFGTVDDQGRQEFSKPLTVLHSSDQSCLKTSELKEPLLSTHVPSSRIMRIQGRADSGSAGSKVSGGLVAILVVVSVGLAIMIGMALRWCIRNFYRETRDTVELGVTIREAKHQKVASEDSSHSNRSSVAPDIYEGTYANVSMDENINVDNNTARTLPRRGGHEEEEGLLESRTASSSRHLSVSSDISLGRAPTSTKPSGPRGPRNSITSSAAHSPRRSSILSDPRALRNSIASSPPQSPGSSFILSDPRVPRDSIASSASQSPRSSFILSDPRALRDSIASSASQSRSSFILSDPRSHRNSISPGPLIFSSGGGSGSYAVVPLDDHDN